MRNLEIHAFDKSSDVDDAVQWGLVESLGGVVCAQCDADLGYSEDLGTFTQFCMVIDDEDTEWFVCFDCAEPVVYCLDNQFFVREIKSSYTGLLEEDLDFE